MALPAPLLVGLASSWTEVVAANVFLGASQGLAWSMTVLMKIDLVGERRRGLALGLNESAGYLGLAAAAAGVLAASFAPTTIVWVGLAALAAIGLVLTGALVRDTGAHVRLEQRTHRPQARPRGLIAACSQAGFVNNLNDALAWGLVPVYLAAHGQSAARIGAVAGLYPAVWGLGQLATGALSDVTGRRPPIVFGMLLQGAALALLAGGEANFGSALAAAALLRRSSTPRSSRPYRMRSPRWSARGRWGATASGATRASSPGRSPPGARRTCSAAPSRSSPA